MYFLRKKGFWFSLKLLSETFFKPLEVFSKILSQIYERVLKKFLLFSSSDKHTSNLKFHENRSSGSSAVPLDRPRGGGRGGEQTDKMKLTVACLIWFENQHKIFTIQHELRVVYPNTQTNDYSSGPGQTT